MRKPKAQKNNSCLRPLGQPSLRRKHHFSLKFTEKQGLPSIWTSKAHRGSVCPLAWLLVVRGKRVGLGVLGYSVKKGWGLWIGPHWLHMITRVPQEVLGLQMQYKFFWNPSLRKPYAISHLCRHLLPTKLIRGGDNLNSEQEELIRMMMDRRRAHLPIKWSNPHLHWALLGSASQWWQHLEVTKAWQG